MKDYYLQANADYMRVQFTSDRGDFWTCENRGGKPVWRDQLKYRPQEGDPERVMFGNRILYDNPMELSSSDMLDVAKTFNLEELQAGEYKMSPPSCYFYRQELTHWYGITEKGRIITISLSGSTLTIEDHGTEGNYFVDPDNEGTRVAETFGIFSADETLIWVMLVNMRAEVPKMVKTYFRDTDSVTVRAISYSEGLIEEWVGKFEKELEGL
ncbi:hypothetical protein [Vibrio phage 5 TSL-2019]|nr:hypothetical protein [Vibrio phage 5 TSL-2019]